MVAVEENSKRPKYQNGNKRRLGFSTVVYVVFGLVQRAIGFLLLPFISRAMSPDEYGSISIVVAGSALFGVVFGSSLESAVFRWTARVTESSNAIIRTSGLYLYLWLPAFALGIAVALFFADFELFGIGSSIWAIEIAACGFMPAVSYFALPAIRAKNDLSRFVALASVSIMTLVAGKVILVILLGYGLLGWVFSDLAAAIACFIMAIGLVRPPKKESCDRASTEILRFSLPLVPHRLAFWAITSLSRPAMALTFPMYQIGIFSLAFNFSTIASVLLMELNRSFLLEYSRETFPAPTFQTRRVARIQVICSLLVPASVAAGTALFAPILISQEFAEAIPLVGILVIAQAAYGLYLVPINYVVQTAGVTNLSWIASVFGSLIIFVSIVFWGRELALVGIAIVTFIGYGAMALLAGGIARLMKLQIEWQALSVPWPAVLLACLGFFFGVLSTQLAAAEFRVMAATGAFVLLAGACFFARTIFDGPESSH